jgi:hypothetical protein
VRCGLRLQFDSRCSVAVAGRSSAGWLSLVGVWGSLSFAMLSLSAGELSAG